jgi:nitric oxide reductase activation protein
VNLKILIHDDLNYPYLGRDDVGFVLHFIQPKRLNRRYVYFQGLKFDLQDPVHKKIIWYIFKASVYHLAVHSQLSDFSVYKKWARDKHLNLSTFVVSLVEDALVNRRLQEVFRMSQAEKAFADAVSLVRMKSSQELPNDTSRLMTGILTRTSTGMIKEGMDEEMSADIEGIAGILGKIKDQSTVDEKIGAARKIYDAITVYGETFEVPSLLYTESHGTNTVFYKKRIPSEDEIRNVMTSSIPLMNPEIRTEEELNVAMQKVGQNEAAQVLLEWREHEDFKSKILASLAEMGKDTEFEGFEFPMEDYVEFQRRRAVLSSPIRRVMHQLRLLKNLAGEDFRQESGYVDLQEAIQVIASKSQRTDVFAREELQTREDAWSILIDASHSLNIFKGEVQGIALCLAEVAKQLILDQNSWGMYAFNSKFYVIKDPLERYNAHVKARIGGLVHNGFTYLPDAILLAAHALTKRIEEARVLVIVSDFFPAGYEDAPAKLGEAVRKVDRLGITMIGIGVNSRAAKDYLRASCIVDNPYSLMKEFTKIFTQVSSV